MSEAPYSKPARLKLVEEAAHSWAQCRHTIASISILATSLSIRMSDVSWYLYQLQW